MLAVLSDTAAVERSPEEVLAYWRDKGATRRGSWRRFLRSYGGGPFEALGPEQLGELGFMLECAVRGKVPARSLEAWLAELAERDDQRAGAEALRRRLVDKANEVELLGKRAA